CWAGVCWTCGCWPGGRKGCCTCGGGWWGGGCCFWGCPDSLGMHIDGIKPAPGGYVFALLKKFAYKMAIVHNKIINNKTKNAYPKYSGAPQPPLHVTLLSPGVWSTVFLG